MKKNFKKIMPVALLAIMVFSVLASFSYSNMNENKNENTEYIIYLQLNYSGQVSGGRILAQNESVLTTIRKYISTIRFDPEAHRIVCIENICNSMQGSEWVFLLNGNLTDEKVDSYVPAPYDIIGFEYR